MLLVKFHGLVVLTASNKFLLSDDIGNKSKLSDSEKPEKVTIQTEKLSQKALDLVSIRLKLKRTDSLGPTFLHTDVNGLHPLNPNI